MPRGVMRNEIGSHIRETFLFEVPRSMKIDPSRGVEKKRGKGGV